MINVNKQVYHELIFAEMFCRIQDHVKVNVRNQVQIAWWEDHDEERIQRDLYWAFGSFLEKEYT